MHSIYTQRRQKLMEKIGDGVAIFRSAPPAVNHYDVEYNYRQDSDFYYLTGLAEPDAVAVLIPNHDEHRFILFVRPRDPLAETWSGRRTGIEGAKEIYGADEAYPIAELEANILPYLLKSDPLYYSFGRDREFNNLVIGWWQKLLDRYAKRGTGPTAIADARLLLAPIRNRKSADELAKIRQAVAIAAEAHNQAHQSTQPGCYEYEIQAQMELLFRVSGGMGPAYPSIVAGGENACILHYVENNAQLNAGDLLLIDAGCCYDYYNSDITRTFPIAGKFSPEQRSLYELVLKAQLAAIAAVKPGNSCQAPHEAAAQVITAGLLELGLLRGELAQLIEEGKYKAFFMHGTSHWLGMDVHDTGMYRVGEGWQNLVPNQVLTIEPGIYIAPDAKAAEDQPEIADRWKGIGIRIEDDVLVTDAGHEVLTAAVPKSIEAMER
jgi:Xaa-Pro aminopeptidase